MANTFKNYTSASVGTSPVTTCTVPSNTTSVTIGLTVSNTTTSQINIDVQAAGVYIIKGAPIPSGSALSVLDGKVILEAADTVVVTSDTAASADVILSVLEQT
jgi:biopolymer transport protein ExbD